MIEAFLPEQFGPSSPLSSHSFEGSLPSIIRERALRYSFGSISVVTDIPEVLSHLENFYRLDSVEQAQEPSWRIICSKVLSRELSAAPLLPDRWGTNLVGEGRSIHIANQSVDSLAIATEKVLRSLVLRELSLRRCCDLHAACIVKDDLIVLLPATMLSGKTTLTIDGALKHGFEIIANDKVIVYPENERALLTSIPDYVSVRGRSAVKFQRELVSLGLSEDDINRVISEGHLDPTVFLHIPPRRFPFRPNTEIDPSQMKLVIAFPTFSEANPGIEVLSPAEAERRLHCLIRTEEFLPPDSSTAHPREALAHVRSEEEVRSDAADALRKLTDRAYAVGYRHQGEIGPLLKFLEKVG